MAEKVKFRCSDGVVIEAEKKVMRCVSEVVRDLTDMADIVIGTIPLQDISSRELKQTITLCEMFFINFELGMGEFDFSEWESFISDMFPSTFPEILNLNADIRRSQEAELIHIESAVKNQPEADRAERIREGLKFDVGTFVSHFTNQSCARFDWEAIKSMHKVCNPFSPASFDSVLVHFEFSRNNSVSILYRVKRRILPSILDRQCGSQARVGYAIHILTLE